MKRTVLTVAVAAMFIPALTVPAPAIAHDRGGRHYHRTDNGIRYWRGDNGRYYCKKPNGTTGLLIGGVAGALVGRSIDTRGDRAVGTIVGAAAGALIGREVERGSVRCR